MELTFPATAVGGAQEQVKQTNIYNLVKTVPKTKQFSSFCYELNHSQRFFLVAVRNKQVMGLQSAQVLMNAALKQVMKMAS